MRDIAYFIDENGDHFYSYTDDEDGMRYATKLSVSDHGVRYQELVNPELLDKSVAPNGNKELEQDVLAKSYQSYLNIYNVWAQREVEEMSLYHKFAKEQGEDNEHTKMKKRTWEKAQERQEEASRMMVEIARGFSVQTKEKLGIV
jgi:hypothetical protein